MGRNTHSTTSNKSAARMNQRLSVSQELRMNRTIGTSEENIPSSLVITYSTDVSIRNIGELNSTSGPNLDATATYLQNLITTFEKSEPLYDTTQLTTSLHRSDTEANVSSNDISFKLTTQPTWSGLTLLPSRASTLPKRGGKARKRLVRTCLLLNVALSTALGLAVGVAMRRAETGLTVGNTFLAFLVVIQKAVLADQRLEGREHVA
ncbi:hypothetical protein BU16DRAFT_581135 [Lophium mytilinum]|uniref:Uncharacterized protein n=1 Tax=Lophium mytilinum TaxID=390894 RepID=A0A6A6QXI2_9PEZI|nr:hypothetical protein BU16DRAFT_581135 [Lophium mytilinum]